MSFYIIVKVSDFDGMWLSDPEPFDYAVEAKRAVAAKPDPQNWMIYECNEYIS